MPRFNMDKIIMDILPQELTINQRWVYLADIVPEICDYYMISDRGLIWNRRLCRLTSLYQSKTYITANLMYIDGIARTTPVHRLVALAFVPNPDPITKIIVNHKNGNKLINEYWNLEWATYKENTAHAIETGLFDPRGCATTTEEQRDEIRRLLKLKKYSCREISEITGISKSIVSHIRYNESWDNENESTLSYTIRNRFTNQDIINLCTYFQNNPEEYSVEYMNKALFECGFDQNPNLRKMASNIYFHKTYTEISNNFNF